VHSVQRMMSTYNCLADSGAMHSAVIPPGLVVAADRSALLDDAPVFREVQL
jgi:hypothetical protein